LVPEVKDDQVRAAASDERDLELLLAIGMRSVMVVPLVVAGAVIGTISFISSDPTRAYDAFDLEIAAATARQAALALENAHRFERERGLVQTLVESTLSAQLPTVEGALLSTVYAPATSDAQAGGDWYDAFELGDGRLLLTVGDVAGRGLQASVIMTNLRQSLNVIAMYESDPARILDAAERAVLQRWPDALATAFVAIYDPAKNRIVYANAGHPYPLARLSDGSIEELRAEGLPVGLRAFRAPFRSRSRSMRDVDLLTFYTDGLIEAARDSEQGERHLREVISSQAAMHVRSPASFVAASCLQAPGWDDVALLVLSFPQSTGWTFSSDNAAAAQNARGEFVAQLRRSASTKSDFAAAELIFGELIGNVSRHAPGPIDIALEWDCGNAVLHVIDRGNGFAEGPVYRVDPMSEVGRGLWLIQEFGRGLRVEPLPGFGSHVRVVLPIDVASSASA
jgi:anti-sigma regulatory factor (Ser/Thr protein kinase)